MISEKMRNMVKNSSAIRAMFEEGKKLAAVYGAENVYDFSLGNPNLPAPKEVAEALVSEVENCDALTLHGYMSNAGFEDVRQAVADSLNARFGMNYDSSCIVMSVGAAGGLNVFLKAVLDMGDEVVVIAGRDKGVKGTVLSRVDDRHVIVEGVNVVKKTVRPNPMAGIEGGIVDKTLPIDQSNLMLVNPETGKGDRVGFKEVDGKKVRVFKSNGAVVGAKAE